MSKNILHKNRNGCALHGALKVVNAVDGLVPIIHSSAGCSIQSKLTDNILGGSNGVHYSGWLETSATAVFEKQVVFGGGSRLREQLKNTIKVQQADLFVVLSGCAPELVGDDVPAMVKEGQDQEFPVISVGTPGFKSNVYKGYELAIKAIIERISYPNLDHKIQKGLVNIFGVIPNQDLFWEGTLVELRKTLAALGLKANTLVGFNQTKANWQTIPNAELNLVVSPWGLEAARQLEKKFGIPYLYFGYLPVGTADTSDFLDIIGEKLSISKDLIEIVKKKKEKFLNYQLQKLAQSYITYDFQKEVALVGETSNVVGISRFLHNSFGQLITTVIITDNPDEELRQQIKDLLPTNDSYPTEIIFTSDGKKIDEWLLKSKPEIILGSSLEQTVADKLSVSLIKISTPTFDKAVLIQTYTGYTGAIELLQDFSEAILGQLQIDKK